MSTPRQRIPADGPRAAVPDEPHRPPARARPPPAARPAAALLAAVVKKFGDDQAGQLAALIAYYGFVSLFPLLLVLVTMLGFVLQGDPSRPRPACCTPRSGSSRSSATSCRTTCTRSKAAAWPWRSAWWARCSAGLGITGATQNAFNQVWHVPLKHRPNFLAWRLRGLGLLAVLGMLASSRPPPRASWPRRRPAPSPSSAGVVLALRRSTWRCSAPPSGCSRADEIPTGDLLPGRDRRRPSCGRSCSTSAATTSTTCVRHAQADLGPVRVRARPARVAVSRRADHVLIAAEINVVHARAAVAAQLLLRPAARGRQARADLLGRGRGARRRGERRGQLRRRPLTIAGLTLILALQWRLRGHPKSTCARNDPALY